MNAKYIIANSYWIKISNNELIYIPQHLLLNGDNVVFDFGVASSAIHDWIYLHKGKDIMMMDFNGNTYKRDMSRKEADSLYKRFTLAPIPTLRYIGLRLFGGLYWGRGTCIIAGCGEDDTYCFIKKDVYVDTNKQIQAYIVNNSGIFERVSFKYYKL